LAEVYREKNRAQAIKVTSKRKFKVEKPWKNERRVPLENEGFFIFMINFMENHYLTPKLINKIRLKIKITLRSVSKSHKFHISSKVKIQEKVMAISL